jgi:signal transduction histidine kinase
MDSLDTTFDVNSRDEVGVLGRSLRDMLQRLSQSRIKLALAERKAAFAQIARQVNHDIRNGFIPIRNVMQHWLEVADHHPHRLPEIFQERKGTILESLTYLESLAGNYARLRPKAEQEMLDLQALLSRVIGQYQGMLGVEVRMVNKLTRAAAMVYADKVELRRAIENIVQNALDAMTEQGKITVIIERTEDQIAVHISDDGPGIATEVMDKLFTPHFTTKADGNGLGLITVQRIIADSGGTVKITSEPGSGTMVSLFLPAVGTNTD